MKKKNRIKKQLYKICKMSAKKDLTGHLGKVVEEDDKLICYVKKSNCKKDGCNYYLFCNGIRDIDKKLALPEFIQTDLSERLAAVGLLPMFGFPTQVRYLFEKPVRKFPPEDVTDRQIDMAMQTFTPGAEIIKDKKVLQSIGFVGYKPQKGSKKPVETCGL